MKGLKDPMLLLPMERAKITWESAENLLELFDEDDIKPKFTDFCIKWVKGKIHPLKLCSHYTLKVRTFLPCPF